MTEKIKNKHKKIMQKIKKHEIKMKPKAYFVLGSVFLGAGIVGVLLLAILLTGVAFFRLRVQGGVEVIKFGKVGLKFLAKVFPWKIVGLAGLGLVGGSYLIRKHDKAYKISLGWMIVGVVLTVVGLGFLADRVGVNDRLRKVDQVRSVIEPKFRADDWLVGEIKEIDEEAGKVVVVTPEGDEVIVRWDERTKRPPIEFEVGDLIRVVGRETEEGYEAEGIMPGEMGWKLIIKNEGGVRPGEGMGPMMPMTPQKRGLKEGIRF